MNRKKIKSSFLVLFLSLSFVSFAQKKDTSIVSSIENVYFLRDDCPNNGSFSITCSGYLLQNGSYKCFYISDISRSAWEGPYKINYRKKTIIFKSKHDGTNRYKLFLNNEGEWVFDSYNKTEHSIQDFMKDYKEYFNE